MFSYLVLDCRTVELESGAFPRVSRHCRNSRADNRRNVREICLDCLHILFLTVGLRRRNAGPFPKDYAITIMAKQTAIGLLRKSALTAYISYI